MKEVITIRYRHSSEGRISLKEWIAALGKEWFIAEWSNECTRRCWHIGNAQLRCRHRRVGIAIRIIDESVEALIDKLPKYHCRVGLVELQHCTSDGHSSRHLKAHATEDILQVTRVGMECTLVELLRVDQLLTACWRWLLLRTKKKNNERWIIRARAINKFASVIGLLSKHDRNVRQCWDEVYN